jgi:hypothetical protein
MFLLPGCAFLSKNQNPNPVQEIRPEPKTSVEKNPNGTPLTGTPLTAVESNPIPMAATGQSNEMSPEYIQMVLSEQVAAFKGLRDDQKAEAIFEGFPIEVYMVMDYATLAQIKELNIDPKSCSGRFLEYVAEKSIQAQSVVVGENSFFTVAYIIQKGKIERLQKGILQPTDVIHEVEIVILYPQFNDKEDMRLLEKEYFPHSAQFQNCTDQTHGGRIAKFKFKSRKLEIEFNNLED